MRNYEEINRTKSKLRSIKTPLIIILLLAISYILSYRWVDNVLELVYLERLIVPLDLSFWFLTVVLIIYALSRIYGKKVKVIGKVQRNIDGVANTVWDTGVGDAVQAVTSNFVTAGAKAVLANSN